MSRRFTFTPLLRAAIVAVVAALIGYALWKYYPRLGAASTKGGFLNISCFIYRDIDRDGQYGLADRPYAGMTLVLSRPHGGTVTTQSNISGFANLRMAAGRKDLDVYEPGAHTYRATPSAPWRVTSGNAEQSVEFKLLEGSPVGIVATDTCAPIGVAEALTVSGTVRADLLGLPVSLKAVSADGRSQALEVSAKGAFSFAAEPGDWQLTLTAADGRSASRTVQVQRTPVVVSMLDLSAPHSAPKPQPVTAGFDTLTSSDTLLEVPNGYAGVNWRNWVATHSKLYGANGYMNGTVSAEYVAYNSSGHPATISADRPFDLDGAFVSIAFTDAKRHDIRIRAWRGSTLVHEDRIRATPEGPLYFAAGYRDITQVEFASTGYWQVVIDDVHLRRD